MAANAREQGFRRRTSAGLGSLKNVSACRSARGIASCVVLLLCANLLVSSLSAADNDAAVKARSEAEQLNESALGLFHKGNVTDAVALWKRADELAERSLPGNALHLDILSNLSLAYYTTGDQHYQLAQVYLDRLIEIDPNRWIAYSILGDMCYEHFQPGCAVGNYDLLLKLNPRYKHAHKVRQRMGTLELLKAEVSRTENSAAKSRMKYALPVVVESDMANFIFYLSINEESFLTRIDIVREDDPLIYQTIKYEPGTVECNPPIGSSGLIAAVDFNGDGYNDVKILCASGDGSGNRYLYYLYHKRNFLFVPFTGGALPDQARGQGDEELRVYKRSAEGQSVADRIYKFSAGRPVAMKRPDQAAPSK